jgi:hypothetical protein
VKVEYVVTQKYQKGAFALLISALDPGLSVEKAENRKTREGPSTASAFLFGN